MLAQQVAVVRGEDDVGVVQLAAGGERVDDALDPLVGGLERLDPVGEPLLHLRWVHVPAPHVLRLVADLLLVECRTLRATVAPRRSVFRGTSERGRRRPPARDLLRAMWCVVGHPQEERLGVAR